MCRISRKNNLALHALPATTTNRVLLLLPSQRQTDFGMQKRRVSLQNNLHHSAMHSPPPWGSESGSCSLVISLLCLPYVTRSPWLLDPAEWAVAGPRICSALVQSHGNAPLPFSSAGLTAACTSFLQKKGGGDKERTPLFFCPRWRAPPRAAFNEWNTSGAQVAVPCTR